MGRKDQLLGLGLLFSGRKGNIGSLETGHQGGTWESGQEEQISLFSYILCSSEVAFFPSCNYYLTSVVS